jgi:chromosome segregation ATPase
VPAAEKLEFSFEDDREIKQTGNVSRIESRGTYNARHIDQLKSDVENLKKEIEAIKSPVAEDEKTQPSVTDERLATVELAIGEIQERLEEISSVNDEITQTYNELVTNVEPLLQANLLTRLQRLEQAEKTGTAASAVPAGAVAAAEQAGTKEAIVAPS